ncbi:hypothetical protein AJ79_05818 [Helicocarpus griseus UAMH5409]|uniref:Anaphase-promoting complex subunit 4-like WD40 domain-containing protein n=1 Tax=Helicocarpus griseus UAMH5409 TaxID=1447875 RepID=A0A2B7XJS7_9EURO|nr:hypothetical protein AJ79_05818 [Helicocarpus griseus UAMH5409]
MSSSHPHPHDHPDQENEDDIYLDAGDAAEEIPADEDHPMDDDFSDDEAGHQEELSFQNDSLAHFDKHTDSLFCIAQHPLHPSITITGSGDDTAYIFDSAADRPLLPRSYESNPQPKGERESLPAIAKLDGHTDSVNAVAFTEPAGEYVVTAGLDGKLRAWRDSSAQKNGTAWTFLAEVQEVEEINWVATCPAKSGGEENKNLIALGANNGSVWVYRIDAQDESDPVSMVACFFQHTESCTAGAWTPDGKLLATVSEDASFYVYDVFGAAAAAGVASPAGTQVVVGLTAQDQRFAVEGGLYSVAIAPTGAFAAVGGAEGHIKVVGLPRLPSSTTAAAQTTSKSKAKSKAGGAAPAAGGGAGTLLASLQAQTDGIETLSFSSPPLTLLAAGSVDGSIALFDTAHRFAIRRHIRSAHEDTAVVKVEFVHDETASAVQSAATGKSRSWLLTSVGMDGVVRRWDTRGGTAAAGYGLVKEWRGHLGMNENEEGEQSGGILGFVQGGEAGRRIVTAGDDGVALVFEE